MVNKKNHEYNLIEELNRMAVVDSKKLRGSKIRGMEFNNARNSGNRTTIFDDIEPSICVERVSNEKYKRVGSRKIRKSNILDDKGIDILNNKEEQLDKEIAKEDNLSITLMVIILVVCFIVGIFLGYMLYRIAINSSNVMFIVKYFFG